ncbi:hypothetical protein [Variovorax terrae]|uniref:Uncharacterized protein n=1 Tax=Variovorax terrae TaxID=2923278 RepID=A0A9X1VYS9_9BURK|nr:hypothetical protein [Variovorax terrae]MCJ0763043.1 hypothetical protein [Variovorax terrae]
MPAAKQPVARKLPAPAKSTKAAPKASAPAKPAAAPAKAKAPLAKAFAEPKADKPAKAKKPKLVRDSFTIPKIEYGVLDELKQRAAKLAHPAKKSEVLRAGIKALAAMSDSAFLAALQAVPAIKTGRPSQS